MKCFYYILPIVVVVSYHINGNGDQILDRTTEKIDELRQIIMEKDLDGLEVKLRKETDPKKQDDLRSRIIGELRSLIVAGDRRKAELAKRIEEREETIRLNPRVPIDRGYEEQKIEKVNEFIGRTRTYITEIGLLDNKGPGKEKITRPPKRR